MKFLVRQDSSEVCILQNATIDQCRQLAVEILKHDHLQYPMEGPQPNAYSPTNLEFIMVDPEGNESEFTTLPSEQYPEGNWAIC